MSGLSAAHAMCEVVTWGIVAGVAGLCAVRAHRRARSGACRRSRSFSSSRGAGILLTDVEELVVDGHFGVRTTAALQMVLTEGGVPSGPIDGQLGARTRAALQAYLKARGYAMGPIDGRWGSRTTRALQKFLLDSGGRPGPIDGRFGRRTVGAFQTLLNSILSTRPVPVAVQATAAPTASAADGNANVPVVVAGAAAPTASAANGSASVPVAVVAGLPVVTGVPPMGAPIA